MKSKVLILILSILFVFDQSAVLSVPQKRTVANQQAGKYSQTAHDAYKQNDYLKAAQYYEKAYQLNKSPILIDNAVTAYLSLGFQLANDKKYEEGIKYANKVLSLKPGNKNAFELLSDTYFARGVDYFYTGEVDKAKADIENSLKYAVNEDQKSKAKEGLSKIADTVKNGQNPVPLYAETPNDGIPQMTELIERKVYGSSSPNLPIIERVNKLEKNILGKTYEDDGLIIRIDRLKRTVLPEYASTVQNDSISGNINSDNYIQDIIAQSQGRVSVFGKMPITVYIKDSEVKPYKKFYGDAVKTAFHDWEKASDNIIKFSFIAEPAKADIQVGWTEEYEDFAWQPTLNKDDISAEKERMKYKKAEALVNMGSMAAMAAGMFVPGLGALGYLGGSLASPYLQYKGTKRDKLSPDVKINTKIIENMPDDQAKIKLEQIALHQIGHALGIFGHSPNPADIMYGDFTAIQLSARDTATIKEIYKQKDEKK